MTAAQSVAAPAITTRPRRRSGIRATTGVGAAMLIMVLAVTVVVPLTPGYDPFRQDLATSMLPPFSSPDHFLGTDALGRDLLDRIALASMVTLAITIAVVIMNAMIGSTLGMLSGYFGGWVGTTIGVLSNVNLAMPVVLLMIAICAVVRPSAWLMMITLGLTWWVGYARVTRNVAAGLRSKDFVLAPLTQGAGTFWVIRKHLIPNVWPQTLIIAVTDLSTIILIESSLEYLGLGVQPPVPSWGSMIFDGQKYLNSDPWLAILPGLVMFLAVAGAHFVSQQFTAEGHGSLLRKGDLR
jgi:peptide/nickel transport system permease protein